MNHRLARILRLWAAPCSLVASFAVGGAQAEDIADKQPTWADPVVINRTIGYAMTNKFWAVFTTKEATECPTGLNDGPREQFKTLFPEDGTKRSVIETSLAREADIWLPTTSPEPLEFKEPQGRISYGLNLDGKVGPNDFTSPEGATGVDNQLYRVMGCTSNYRGPDGFNYVYINGKLERLIFNRILIEITDVDDLTNDSDVTVTTYRGLDFLLRDAAGDFAPGGTQRVDGRWGKRFIQRFAGKIVDGVLTTAAADVYFPETDGHENQSVQLMRDLRFELRLTSAGAEGLMGGYADIDSMYYAMLQTWSTHHHAYGQDAAASRYKALRRHADAYPDPKTGHNTAISSAFQVRFSQAFLQHPPKATASKKDKPDQLASLKAE